ncbi:photoreceptor cilium actin regulator-like [Neolamprologus brichardi]|uniref:photoreceptor cilium actin regulator-like n=1 Tax=Neolamprologus brichardi TaxID=32507 RepID=UPI001643ECA5|nr:photoreceptor cilium actin regulator-like [Neolamprologus brichardi]
MSCGLTLKVSGFHSEETELFPLVSDAKTVPNLQDTDETEVNTMPQEIITDVEQTKGIKKTAKQKRKARQGKKRSFENHRKFCHVQTKVDFPPHMLRAHQAAYNFLNPNISKYETLLGLLDQAAQTQLSLQPMMSALVLRFEEINQALEDMADEGELMLKEHGEYMTLPSGMICSANPRMMPRKSGLLQLSDAVNDKESSVNSGNNNNSWPDSKDELDMDNLPPPPPEVLMDNSFQSTQVLAGTEVGLQKPFSSQVINPKIGIFHRLKASIHNVEVLPNRVCMRPRSIAISPAHPVTQDGVTGTQDADQLQSETDLNLEIKKANNLYQKACKIIHLRDAAESSDKRNIVEPGIRATSPLQLTIDRKYNSNEFYEGELSSCSLTVKAPPVSRVRLPPSCPSTCKRFPSPPVIRPQSTSRHSSRPSSPRTVTRCTDNKTEEIIPSVSFRDARSVFCQNEFQNLKTCLPPERSVLPRQGGEVPRGRLLTRATDTSTRRTQSDHRPSGTLHSEFLKDASLASMQEKGSNLLPQNTG